MTIGAATQHRVQGTLAAGALVVGGDTAGLLGGGGTSANPVSIGTSYGKIFSSYWTSAATGGSVEGRYERLYQTAANANTINCGREYLTLSAICGNASGQHTSLSFGSAAGSVTGLGLAHRNTLHVPNRALAANGTYAALQAEIYCDGNSADISPVTEHSILRMCVDGGNATSQNLIKNAIAIRATSQTDGTGQMIYTHTHSAGNAAGSIRILVNGAVKYLKFWDAE